MRRIFFFLGVLCMVAAVSGYMPRSSRRYAGGYTYYYLPHNYHSALRFQAVYEPQLRTEEPVHHAPAVHEDTDSVTVAFEYGAHQAAQEEGTLLRPKPDAKKLEEARAAADKAVVEAAEKAVKEGDTVSVDALPTKSMASNHTVVKETETTVHTTTPRVNSTTTNSTVIFKDRNDTKVTNTTHPTRGNTTHPRHGNQTSPVGAPTNTTSSAQVAMTVAAANLALPLLGFAFIHSVL